MFVFVAIANIMMVLVWRLAWFSFLALAHELRWVFYSGRIFCLFQS